MDAILVDDVRKGSVSPADVGDGTHLRNLLPRLQIIDESSPSKPDNYRISPITPLSAGVSPATPASSTSEKDPTTIESVLKDWSGRGSHVDFLPTETVPLTQGRFLGYGSMGGVYETTVKGHVFAWKRIYCRRKIGDRERKEIKILKKVSHRHIIKLAGSYTHGPFIGFLLHPVAVCDLATLLEDIEAHWAAKSDATQRDRLTTLGLHDAFDYSISEFLLSKIGCIVGAVEYLHHQKIRHKDLKPSNILLSPNGLWLTDFGTATDFSLQTVSTTDNWERGTPKYFPPEVASYKPSGRAADIFSLGCIMLEICLMCEDHSLETLREHRSVGDKSYQANIPRITEWAYFNHPWTIMEDRDLVRIICDMLQSNPDDRPSISRVSTRLSYIDFIRVNEGWVSLFGDCCRKEFISMENHKEELAKQKARSDDTIRFLKTQLARSEAANASYAAYHRHVQDLLKKIQPDHVSPQEESKLFEIIQLSRIKDEMTELREKIAAYTEIVGNKDEEQIRQKYPSCPICSVVFPSNEEIAQHMNLNHPAKDRVWIEAPNSWDSVSRIPNHRQSDCPYCDNQTFNNSLLYRQHWEDFHATVSLEEFVKDTESMHINGPRDHKQRVLIPCLVCSERFRNQESLRIHWEERHTNEHDHKGEMSTLLERRDLVFQ
ncbi:kinase-like protein [Periconia macrospinosa]|uniref:non-specific serine/threonine protein kinase n=1 Tax=Periconia macrospinosa TaxID=97972 RepID=A0A2V1DPJ8_9PLEO|nr:kinase-like protein [Periconia macrospinosa]